MVQRLYLLLVLISATDVFGQTSQGSIMASGGAAITYFGNGKEQNFTNVDRPSSAVSLEFSPSIGYFLTRGFVVGANVSFERFKLDNDITKEETTVRQFLAGPFASYYFKNNTFITSSFGIGSKNIRDKGIDGLGGTTDRREIERYYQWQVGAGYAIFLNENVAIEPYIAFRQQRQYNQGINNQKFRNSFFITGLDINIFLKRKK